MDNGKNKSGAAFNIVLARPEIPQNTGNIGRLCVNTGSALHLVKPLGFSLEDKYVRRAGLDYWPYLDLTVWERWGDFLTAADMSKARFFSTKGTKTFWECEFAPGDFLVFGNETSGLPDGVAEEFAESMYKIPMQGPHSRSYNLANATAIVLFEAIRQTAT